MRRTLFVVPTGDLPIFDGAMARDIARRECRRLEGWIQAEHATKAEDGPADGGRSDDGSHATPEWLSGLEERIFDALAAGDELLTRELGQRIPDLATRITLGSGKWTTRAPISCRVLFLMAMEGRIVRTRPAGSWRSSQYRWADASRWLEGGSAGFVLRDDLDDVEHGIPERSAVPPATSVGFLPSLDPTVMGWKHRGWYLGPHADALFDRCPRSPLLPRPISG